MSTFFKLRVLSTFMLRDHSDRKIGCESVNWICWSQNGVMWWALVNCVGFATKQGISCPAQRLLAFPVGQLHGFS